MSYTIPATENIRAELIDNSITMSNDGFNTVQYTQVSPNTESLSSNVLANEVIFQIRLPQTYFGDPSKVLYNNRHSRTITTDDLGLNLVDPISEHIFTSGTLRINGVHICDAQNFTQLSRLSNRLTFSALHNENAYSYDRTVIADQASGALAETYYHESWPVFAPFTLLHPELIFPPGSFIEVILRVDGTSANYTTKALEGKCSADASGAVPTNFTYKIYSQWLDFPMYRSENPLKSEYIIKLLAPEIYPRAANSLICDYQFAVSGNPTLVGVFFQDTRINSLAATDTANDYAISGSRFLYGASDLTSLLPADGTTTTGVTAGSPLTIQFDISGHKLPSNSIDNSYGMYGGYALSMYNGFNMLNRDLTAESYSDWLYQGPIWCLASVLDEAESVSNVGCRVTFKTSAPSSAHMMFFIVRQRLISISYDTSTGVPVETRVSA